MWAPLPIIKVSWGDTPHNPPPWGLRSPGPPVFAHPRELRVRWRFGPHSWADPITPPNFPPTLAGKGVRGLGQKGTPPTTPRQGGFAPLDPLFLPTPVGLRFASALCPTRGEVVGVDSLLPLWQAANVV